MSADPLFNADGTMNYEEARKLFGQGRAQPKPKPLPDEPTTIESLAVEVAPCDDCRSVPTCRTGQACAAFVHFVVEGQDSPLARREPSERIYRRLFREHPEMVSV
jgi:hypothetical protein